MACPFHWRMEGVVLAADYDLDDKHGVAVDLSFGAKGSPSMQGIAVLHELKGRLGLDFRFDLLGGLARIDIDVDWLARGIGR
eukprot:9470532-Pyramimonas_sp.AAC.1